MDCVRFNDDFAFANTKCTWVGHRLTAHLGPQQCQRTGIVNIGPKHHYSAKTGSLAMQYTRRFSLDLDKNLRCKFIHAQIVASDDDTSFEQMPFHYIVECMFCQFNNLQLASTLDRGRRESQNYLEGSRHRAMATSASSDDGIINSFGFSDSFGFSITA